MNDPKQWKIAAALAAKCGLDWGRWALGLTAPCTCTPYERDGRMWHEADCRGPERLRTMQADHGMDLGEQLWRRGAVPVAEPWDVEAYRTDCARRGVEPGPLPSLRHTRWAVESRKLDPRFIAVVRAGDAVLDVLGDGTVRWYGESRHTSLDDLARAVELARVARDATKSEPNELGRMMKAADGGEG